MIDDFDITKCFADDRKDFWENFSKRTEDNFVGIYNTKETCILPDLDSCSKNLYIYHQALWNKQCKTFAVPPSTISKDGLHLEITIEGHKLTLSSDSFISIYWHYKDMQNTIKDIKENKEQPEFKKALNVIQNSDNALKEKRKFDKNWTDWKKFVWLYLQKSNTIGGFIVFPTTHNSINFRRGNRYGPIRDRFDLTLECIRRAYVSGALDFDDNPLFRSFEADKEFFKMFGSFENYINFFCLNSWIEDGHVLSLLDNKPLDNWDFNKDKPLPTKDNWWTFYENMINRLEARNTAIQALFLKEK